MQVQIDPNSVLVDQAGPEFPADARVVEVRALDGKHYYHGKGLIPVLQAFRLALNVASVGVINTDHWGCYEDERRAREDYEASGQAAYDETRADRHYADDCQASLQAILTAEHDDSLWNR